MVGVKGRSAIAFVALLLVLLVCGAAYADNYTFRRTSAGDATAGAVTLRTSDFPRVGLTGGRVKPDETPNNDSCNGYTPKQRDLVVVGDAESRFRDSRRSVQVDSQIELFQSTAMAATDVQRGVRTLTAACQAQAAKQEHVKLVSYSLLGRPRCSCDFAFSAVAEVKTARPNFDLLVLITGIRKARFEASVITTVGKPTNDARGAAVSGRTALALQGLAVKAVVSRLRAA